jgi:hypothetical protein
MGAHSSRYISLVKQYLLRGFAMVRRESVRALYLVVDATLVVFAISTGD